MIVSTLIMSIAVVGMLSGLAGATRNAARLRDYDRVAQLAQMRMNDLLVDPALRPGTPLSGTFDASITGGLEAGWQAQSSLFEQAPPPHPPAAGETVLDRIVLDVWWMSGSTRRTFTVESVRRRVVTAADVAAGAGQ